VRPNEGKPGVLLLHNRYREPGGEERSVAAIRELLLARGHEVELLERSSSELTGGGGRARAGLAMLRGGDSPAEVAAAVEHSGATVVHAHNLHPLLGPRALAAARRTGARVVVHLHNYRLFCAIAIAYRDGDVCTRCHGRNTVPGLRLRCRGGIAEPAIYAAALSLHQRRTLSLADRFVVPSRAAVTRLASFGMPIERIDVLHNFLPARELAGESRAHEGGYGLFAGRLAEEKGVDTAVEAARRSGVELVVAGTGPDEGRLRKLAAGAPVRFAGRLSGDELARVRREAAFAVVPSRWDEPCPYAAIEAMGAGLPVLAADVGGLPELVGTDVTLPPRAVEVWATAMTELSQDREARRERGEAALARARDLFGPDRFYSGLSDVYARARGEV
jgi:glycosyltransferase involved in cell wall biosynthesis